MKNCLLALACALLLALPFRSVAAGPPEVVVVRITETGKVRAVISRGAGKTENVEFENGTSESEQTQAAEGYQVLIQKLYQEGFVLKSTFTTPLLNGYGSVTLIFTKEQ